MHRPRHLDATPLIGVLLVLLLLPFAAHHTMEIQLPRDIGGCSDGPRPKATIYTLHADLSATLQDELGSRHPDPIDVFQARFEPVAPVVYVVAEPAVPWGEVVGFIDRIKTRAPPGTVVALDVSASGP